MAASSIRPDVLEMIRADWHHAPRGTKSAVVAKWAGRLNLSESTMYRELKKDQPARRKKRCDAGSCKIDGIEEAARTVAAVKKAPPEHKGELTTEDAIKLAISNGLIPAEFADRRSSIERHIRRTGAHRRNRRVQRYQAERPNELHHVDASSSDVFFIQDFTEDGDCLLRLYKGHPIYKNKPAPHRLRVWIYGITDDHSGVHAARYVPALGETAIDNLDFLQWVWAKTDDKEFFGIPEKLKGDCGPMMRGKAANDFFERLGIEILGSDPGNKEAHGKIERPWRTLWQRFERPFFVEPDKFEITLSELNERLTHYLEVYNGKPHRFERRVSRIQAWRRIQGQGGAVALGENAMEGIAKRHKRKVGQDGVVWLDNVAYEVPNLHDRWVWLWESITDGRIVVEDMETGDKHEVKPFKPNPIGEYRQPKDDAHQKALKAGKALRATGGLRNTLYSEAKDHGNVTPMPIRTKETAEPESPLDVGDAYRSLAEAVAGFIALTGIPLPEGSNERADIESLILDAGLSREYVRTLASDVQQAAEG